MSSGLSSPVSSTRSSPSSAMTLVFTPEPGSDDATRVRQEFSAMRERLTEARRRFDTMADYSPGTQAEILQRVEAVSQEVEEMSRRVNDVLGTEDERDTVC